MRGLQRDVYGGLGWSEHLTEWMRGDIHRTHVVVGGVVMAGRVSGKVLPLGVYPDRGVEVEG